MAEAVRDIRIKRVYEAPGDDGRRVLVDRLWPRGLSKERIHADLWGKEAAPSSKLRRWFHRAPDQWEEFRRRYIEELKGSFAVETLLDLAGEGKITLLYASRDVEHNHARVLKEYLLSQAGR